MKTYILYRRRNLLRENEFAWQIDCDGRVFSASSYKDPITLETFAQRAAETSSILGREIKGGDRLTTHATTFIPDNEYIDEPVSSDEIINFWKAYRTALK